MMKDRVSGTIGQRRGKGFKCGAGVLSAEQMGSAHCVGLREALKAATPEKQTQTLRTRKRRSYANL